MEMFLIVLGMLFVFSIGWIGIIKVGTICDENLVTEDYDIEEQIERELGE